MYGCVLFIHVLAATVWTGGHLVVATTVLPALHAPLRIIPRLSAATLPAMARRIVWVTVVSVLFVAVGVSFRGGLLA